MSAGSVDMASRLIGRLLHDAGGLYQDHLEALRKKAGRDGSPLGLAPHRRQWPSEQGITIDDAYRC